MSKMKGMSKFQKVYTFSQLKSENSDKMLSKHEFNLCI